MCGIAGICTGYINRIDNMQNMLFAMRDRGPDHKGIWLDDRNGVVLGHTRLAILDLSPKGNQPMESHNGRFIITYNGEIYNHKVIRKELLSRGSTFFGNSDTEVLLEAISCMGIRETLQLVKGMFSFCLYDKLMGKIYLIRDRMGEKPLFYGMIGNSFVFASDLSAIKTIREFKKQINTEVLYEYFLYGYISGEQSIYQKIYRLIPGSVLELDIQTGRSKISKYWDINEVSQLCLKNPFQGSREDAKEILNELLLHSVKDQLMADVPVGAFLSGGTDSTLIVSLMKQASSNEVNTFTIGFEENEKDEAVYAKHIAEYLETKHEEYYLGKGDLIDAVFKMPGMYSEPFGDNSAIPIYLVSKMAKKKVTVTLSGDGGDELFAGYNEFRYLYEIWRCVSLNDEEQLHRLEKNKYKFRQYMQAKNIDEIYQAYFNYSPALDQMLIFNKDKVILTPILKQEMEELMLLYQKRYLADDILAKVDRAGMSVSLENRIPLLDKDIVEFSWKLPLSWKNDGSTTKCILKELLYNYVPKNLLDRQKIGFNLPVKELMWEKKMLQWGMICCSQLKLKEKGI